MDFEYIYPVLILFGSFAVMLAIGVPITFAIGLSSLLSIITALPPDAAISVISQKMTVGLDGFTLLAIPFFVLAGNIMNTGGIARRLVNLAQALVGRLPGSLAHCNILANTLFGAISGSAVASAAAGKCGAGGHLTNDNTGRRRTSDENAANLSGYRALDCKLFCFAWLAGERCFSAG